MGAIWNEFVQGMLQYSRDAFVDLDPWFYPLVFVGVFGFIYAGMQSITVMIVGVLVTFGIFGADFFIEIPIITNFFYIITVIGIVLLVVTLVTKKITSR